MKLMLAFLMGALSMLLIMHIGRFFQKQFYKWLAEHKSRQDFIRLHGSEIGEEYAGEFWDKIHKS